MCLDGNPLGFDELGRPIYGDSASASASGSGVDVKSLQGGGMGVGAPAFTGGMPAGRGGIGLMDDYQSAAQAQIAALSATGGGNASQPHSQPAFVGGAQPPFGAIGSQGMMMMGAGGGGPGGYMGPNMGGGRDQLPSMRHYQDQAPYHHPGQLADQGPSHHMNERGPRAPDGCGVDEDNAVIMVYGMDPELVNCDKLFNLFCLYGNVMRVRGETKRSFEPQF